MLMGLCASQPSLVNYSSAKVRRFSQLEEMMKKHNANFNIFTHFAYACNCNLLATGGIADRPLTQPGWGRPVDPLDAVCKEYKDCQRCVTETHGPNCIGEEIRYRFRYGADWQGEKAICEDRAGTCQRAICECDSKFALQHSFAKENYNPTYSHFFMGFQYERICPNLCHINEFEITNTEAYTGNTDLNGIYSVTSNLVNEYKCYKNGDNQIIHEDDVYGSPGWVIYKGSKAVFYGKGEQLCPVHVQWVYLADGFKTDRETAPGAFGLHWNGKLLPNLINDKLALDEKCCSADEGAHQVFNTFTHFCCANGEVRLNGELCS